jgi:hypothetical protein
MLTTMTNFPFIPRINSYILRDVFAIISFINLTVFVSIPRHIQLGHVIKLGHVIFYF